MANEEILGHERAYDYDTGLKFIMNFLDSRKGKMGAVLLNGAGPNVGKTTLAGEISKLLMSEGDRRGIVYEDLPRFENGVTTLRMQFPGHDLSKMCVPIKVVEHNGSFPKDKGKQLKEYLINDFIGDIRKSLGIDVDPAAILPVNLQSMTKHFPTEHFPADIMITNQYAKRK